MWVKACVLLSTKSDSVRMPETKCSYNRVFPSECIKDHAFYNTKVVPV